MSQRLCLCSLKGKQNHDALIYTLYRLSWSVDMLSVFLFFEVMSPITTVLVSSVISASLEACLSLRLSQLFPTCCS